MTSSPAKLMPPRSQSRSHRRLSRRACKPAAATNCPELFEVIACQTRQLFNEDDAPFDDERASLAVVEDTSKSSDVTKPAAPLIPAAPAVVAENSTQSQGRAADIPWPVFAPVDGDRAATDSCRSRNDGPLACLRTNRSDRRPDARSEIPLVRRTAAAWFILGSRLGPGCRLDTPGHVCVDGRFGWIGAGRGHGTLRSEHLGCACHVTKIIRPHRWWTIRPRHGSSTSISSSDGSGSSMTCR